MTANLRINASRFGRLIGFASRLHLLALPLALSLLLAGFANPQSDSKKDKKKKPEPEPFIIQQVTHGMGLSALGEISPDRKSILLLARRPGETPNLYSMKIADRSITSPLTSFKLGVTDARWSPDGSSVAFAGYGDASSFPEIYTLALGTSRLRRLTSNAFSDKEPVYTPDGKRLLFTSDESPLPEAAFGTLHIVSVDLSGGKPEVFTEDDGSSIRPDISSDGKSVLLVKVDERTGRHSLFQYGFDGKEQRSLSERKFARIHRYIHAPGGSIVVWAQEEAEQQEGVYLLDPRSGEVRALPDPDLPKRNPTVSPDGRFIAFLSPTDLGTQVVLFDSISGEIKQITTRPGNAQSPVFVSNTEILFGSNREKGENEIFLVDLSKPASDEKKKK
jgi:Tol biopolymer transport system component